MSVSWQDQETFLLSNCRIRWNGENWSLFEMTRYAMTRNQDVSRVRTSILCTPAHSSHCSQVKCFNNWGFHTAKSKGNELFEFKMMSFILITTYQRFELFEFIKAHHECLVELKVLTMTIFLSSVFAKVNIFHSYQWVCLEFECVGYNGFWRGLNNGAHYPMYGALSFRKYSSKLLHVCE